MSQADQIIDQILASKEKSDKKRRGLVAQFKALPDPEREATEPRLCQLLKQTDIEELLRPWIPELLALVSTSTAYQSLFEQLPLEQSLHVKGIITYFLTHSGGKDEYVMAAIREFEKERTLIGRRTLARNLAKAGNPATIPKFIELINDARDWDIRRRAAWALGRLQATEAVNPLAERLQVEDKLVDQSPSPEDSMLVSREIIKTLLIINDPQAVPGLLKVLQDRDRPTELHLDILRAVGQLASPDDEDVIKTLLEVICYPDRIVALTATDTLQNLLQVEQAARRLAEFGLKQTDPQRLSQVADALRLIGGMEVIGYLQSVRGDTKEESRAQALLEQIGGRQALNVLVDRRLNALAQAQGRVKEFDEQALKIFTETIGQAKRGFMISLVMSGLVFAVGLFLLVGSASILFWGNPNRAQMVIGFVGGLTGIGSILFMFYRDPLGRIERAVSNLVQTEVAFLGYIRQVTQITAMFEREYLDNDSFGVKELEGLLGYTDHTMKETMPLINRYTAQSANKADNLIPATDKKL